MQCSKSAGYLVYPLMILVFCAAPFLRAQTSGSPEQSTPAQSSPAQSSPAPSSEPQTTGAPATDNLPPQTQPDSSSSQPQTNYPNEQDRARLAREAQERVRARRAARTKATIQDTYSHKYDIYFGYAYLRMRPGHNLQHTTEYGWNVGFTGYLNQKLGVTADLRGLYSNAYVGINPYALFKPFISHYSVMAGPQYYVRQRKNYAVSAVVMAGITHNLFDANSAGLPGTLVGLYPNETRFTMAAAVPVDINLGPGLAFRISPDYNLMTLGGDVQHNLGFTLGLNYRFGRR
jgi:hypothetical protein